jgi:5'-3' exonuclease
MNKILIVDTSWLYNLYYYVNKDKGYKDPAVHGVIYFLTLLHRNIDKYKQIFFVLDGEHACEDKKKLLPTYKEGRSDKTEVYKNFNDFLKLISKYPKTTIIKNDVKEADDIIAYLAIQYAQQNEVILYSGDKDLIQLAGISDNIKITSKYSSGSFEFLANTEIFQKFKNSKKEDFSRISTDKKDILKYRVLSGDTSDNISGIYRLSDVNKKKIIQAWLEDDLNDRILAEIILRIEDMNLRHKIAENFDIILRNWELMDLGHVCTNYKVKKFTKKINIEITEEDLQILIKNYNLVDYNRVIK